MSFTPVVAAALSGASTGQLAYWRSARASEPLLAPAHHEPRSRASYSYRDVVALRTFVYSAAATYRFSASARQWPALGSLATTSICPITH